MTAATTKFFRAGSTECDRHPLARTELHCQRCNRPICPKCAKRTAVGYKCPGCVRHIQNKFFNGRWSDYLTAPLIALPLSLLAAGLFTFLIGGYGWFSWFITFFAAPIASGFIVEAVHWSVHKCRSRYLAHVVAGCFILASVSVILLALLLSGVGGQIFDGVYVLIEPGILLVVGTGTIIARLR